MCLVTVIYLPALNGPFVLDDQTTIVENKHITHPEELLKLNPLQHVVERSFARFTFLLSARGNGELSEFQFHLTGLLIHLVNGFFSISVCFTYATVSQWKGIATHFHSRLDGSCKSNHLSHDQQHHKLIQMMVSGSE